MVNKNENNTQSSSARCNIRCNYCKQFAILLLITLNRKGIIIITIIIIIIQILIIKVVTQVGEIKIKFLIIKIISVIEETGIILDVIFETKMVLVIFEIKMVLIILEKQNGFNNFRNQNGFNNFRNQNGFSNTSYGFAAGTGSFTGAMGQHRWGNQAENNFNSVFFSFSTNQTQSSGSSNNIPLVQYAAAFGAFSVNNVCDIDSPWNNSLNTSLVPFNSVTDCDIFLNDSYSFSVYHSSTNKVDLIDFFCHELFNEINVYVNMNHSNTVEDYCNNFKEKENIFNLNNEIKRENLVAEIPRYKYDNCMFPSCTGSFVPPTSFDVFAGSAITPSPQISIFNFLFDTGATDHMVAHASMLDSISQVDSNLIIQGFSTEVVGRPTCKGKMSITVLNIEIEIVRRELKDVLVVLNLGSCLISEDPLTRNGAIIELLILMLTLCVVMIALH